MSKSLIQTVNASQQVVSAGSVINLGSVLRRYGCNCRLNGNAIEIEGCGYYEVTATVTLIPQATGNVTVALYENGAPIQGATATGAVSTVGNSVTLPLVTTLRQGCCCDTASSLSCVLVSGASTVSNISLRVEKS